MLELRVVENEKQLGILKPGPVAPVALEAFMQHGADTHLALVDSTGAVRARCSVWWKNAAALPGRRMGCVGHYAAGDDESAAQLLSTAVDLLGANGCDWALGPMDGNTWRSYRFVTDRGDEPPFFLEPENPPSFPAQFEQAGFTPLAKYYSASNSDLSRQDNRLNEIEWRMTESGIRIRTLNPDRFEQDLNSIYELSLVSFAGNFLYTPITRSEFVNQYVKIRPILRPEFCFIAEQQSQVVGFIFAIPDMAQARRGVAVDTLIAKTLAVLPQRSRAGLGHLLLARCQQAARQAGMKRVIHALMHEKNKSRNLSLKYASMIRGYTLYSKPIGP